MTEFSIFLNFPSVFHLFFIPYCSEVKVSAWNAGDPGSIPGSGRSPGEGNGTPLQYSCLENPMDGEASQTRLSDFTEQNRMYMFPCYSLNLSHAFLPLLYPHICSLCLRLHCCPAYRFISTIFLDSIYMS